MGTKTDEFIDLCKGKDVSQSSDNDVHKLAASLVSLCNERHHTCGETSNLLSACSSHDSFSENAESKINLRASDSSEDTGQKFAEEQSFGDNNSCISGSDNKNVMACNNDGDTERKNTPFRLASVDSFSKSGTPNNDQPASCCVSSSPFCEVENSCPSRREKFSNESSHAIAVCSNQSDLSENSSLRVSFSGTSCLKRESSECYEEQVESSLRRVTTCRFGGQINEVNSNAECVKPDAEKTDGIVAAVVMKCPVRKGDFGQACGMADESDIVKPHLHSQPVADRWNAVEVEVKVCDICGDAGREYLLANCSKCSDGAEHIYCMRVKMDKIPEGDWLCEDCLVNEDTKKHMQDKFEEEIAMSSSPPSLKKTIQNSGNLSACDESNSLKLVKKTSGIKESRKDEVKSSAHFSSKRPANGLEVISVAKRMVLESKKQSGFFGKEKMKQTHEVIPSGSLSKLKSFKTMHSKEKVQLSDGANRKQNFARENPIINDKEVKVSRMMKSISFNDASSGYTNAADSKVILLRSKSCHVEDLKMLRHAKEKSSTETGCTSKFYKPFICSPVSDSGISASMTNQKVSHHGESILPHPNGDLADVKCHVKSNNLSNSSSPLNTKPNEDQNRVFNDVEQHILYSADMAENTNSNDSNTTLHSKKSTSLKDFSSFAPVAALSSWISVVPRLGYIWKGQFEIQGGGRFLSSCDGIQAHLSTCASPKVIEVVQKLPQKIILEEVPRSNKWPTQFLEKHATEDNIALYFFANDIDSYERSYKDLLDCMIKNDLSLKVNLDGIELLVFASNLLPEKSQRWNKLLFLWGVFRGRRLNCSSELQNLHETICISSRNEVYPSQNQDLSDLAISASQSLCSHAHSIESLSASSATQDLVQKSKSFNLLDQLASNRMTEFCGPKTFLVEHQSVDFQTGADCQQTYPFWAKTEYMSRDVPHLKSSEIQEKGSKRGQTGQIVDHPFKEDLEHKVRGMGIDEERKCKRLKNCPSEVREFNSSGNMKGLSEAFPVGTNGLGPSFAGNKHISGEAHDTSFSRIEFKAANICLKDSSDDLESEVPNLELSLGIEKGSTKQISMPPSAAMCGEKIRDKYSKQATNEEKGDNKPKVSLSLSLALPSSGMEQGSKPWSETNLLLPVWHGVNTTLSL